MRIKLFRFASIGLAAFALCALAAPASARNCPGNPNAIGTSRTIVVDPTDHRKIGTMNYAETLPLVDKEVVLTFDDGPLPPYSNKILDILAAECVKATYFIVGVMARANPEVVRRVYEHGHTVGTHSLSHPLHFRALGLEEARAQVDGGIAATAAALGDATKVAPFFRFPGFGHSAPVEAYAASRGLMVWGADAPADDWLRLGAHEVAKRAVRRLESKGKGILLLHDIHQRTVDALPILLEGAQGARLPHRPCAARNADTAGDRDGRGGLEAQFAHVAAKRAGAGGGAGEPQSSTGCGCRTDPADELCQLNEPPRGEADLCRRCRGPARQADPDRLAGHSRDPIAQAAATFDFATGSVTATAGSSPAP